ncbi:hypothetical protein EG68_09119 [Paragonimus skrjabini miyazakii]|uniref:Uncharacterized protein n=1 Tax=Paragonimus skrjabini miyazakii TaxID=59628 RepID=A0A8S9YIP1_9TREM|nr:hypothetical protein EG68_09119 [Paragonimus skrjabini miyazakii]
MSCNITSGFSLLHTEAARLIPCLPVCYQRTKVRHFHGDRVHELRKSVLTLENVPINITLNRSWCTLLGRFNSFKRGYLCKLLHLEVGVRFHVAEIPCDIKAGAFTFFYSSIFRAHYKNPPKRQY